MCAAVGNAKRRHSLQEIESGSTAVSRVFEGRLRSALVLPKQKPSITTQPFFTLPLDIQVQCTV